MVTLARSSGVMAVKRARLWATSRVSWLLSGCLALPGARSMMMPGWQCDHAAVLLVEVGVQRNTYTRP